MNSERTEFVKDFHIKNPNWQRNQLLNTLFIECQTNYANHLLQSRGHVFLNEMYDMLSIDRTAEGQRFGWINTDVNNEVEIQTDTVDGVIKMTFKTHGDILELIPSEE